MTVRLQAGVARRLRDALLGATAGWARRESFDDAVVARIRHGLILDQHLHYVERVPAYRRLARELALDGPATLEAIAGNLVFSVELYKSYDRSWLTDGDFTAMTGWLRDVSTCSPAPPGPEVRTLDAWRAWLAGQGVQISLSSGTSGRPSIVPRDRETWAALCGNGRYYGEVRTRTADCLLLVPRLGTLGLQAAATGLAAGAERTHWLLESEAQAQGDWRPPATDSAVAFLERAAAERRPALVFGPPGEAATLCEAMLAQGRSVRLATGSRVVTGGGWKTGRPLARPDLLAVVRSALGLAPSSVSDGYSATELNAVLSTCDEGRYHVPPLLEVLLLDDAFEWLGPGDGEGLLAFLDPFACSYVGFLAFGDYARVTSAPCPCGLAGAALVGEIVRAPAQEPRGCAGALDSVLA